MKSIALALPLLALASCNQRESEPAKPPAKVVVRSDQQDQLHNMSELNRAIGLKRAIYASGSRCQRVTETRFVGPYKNMDMWAVRCADGRDWALFVGADNSVQVRLCKDTEAVGLPACKLETSPGA